MDPKPLALREVKPKNARTKRYLDNKAPQSVENPRTTLFLRYTTSSEVVNLVLKDLNALKRPLAIKFSKKNSIHPFEDASSFEFLSDKNDASMIVFGSHSKKRPNCLTFVRLFDYKVLDMVEMMIDSDSMRTIQQFKTATKPAVGLKPLLSFSGSAFESLTPNAYTMTKSMFTDLFKGPDVENIDVEGLQYMIHFSVDDEEGDVKPSVHMRCFLLKTKKSGTNLPRVEVEEMGPRIDFRVGRIREPDPEIWKASMRKPKSLEAKPKKNIETDIIGDKVGRIHLGKQDLGQLQTRKMKGLKRSRDVADDEEGLMVGEIEPATTEKRAKVKA